MAAGGEGDRRRRARRAGDRGVAARLRQALRWRRRGTVSLVGLPPGDFATPIFDVVLKRITIRGSIVGTRKDLAEALAFAAEGKVHSHIHQRSSRTSTGSSATSRQGTWTAAW